MSKVVYSKTADQGSLYEYYSGEFTLEVNKGGSHALFEDVNTDATIDVSGSGLKANKSGMFTAGSIDELVLTNSVGETIVTIDGDYTAKDLSQAGSNGFSYLLEKLFEGNDQIVGSKGDDYLLGFGGKDKINGGVGYDLLDGGAGNGDQLIGGKGDDYFTFSAGNGNDTVLDFDAKGVKDGESYYEHDSIYLFTNDYHITKNKDGDAVIVLDETKETLTLDGVHKADLHDYDFYIYQPM